jgi:hypothetical protein
LGGAYVFSLIVASLIAFLEPPPLPLVEMSVKESSSTQKLLSSGSEALGSQPEAKRLLAHTEGYWYLFDEREKRLLVVPDGDDYVVWFPQYVEIVNSSEAFKLEVPVTWDERDDVRDKSGKTDNNPSGYDYADLTVSTNVDNWSKQYGVEAGVNIRARRGSRSTDEVDKYLDKLKNKTLKGTGCKYVDRWHHEVHDKDRVLEGEVARWTDCSGEGNTIVAVAVLPEDGNFMVTLEIDMPKGGAQEHVDHVLNNFWVDGTRLPSS